MLRTSLSLREDNAGALRDKVLSGARPERGGGPARTCGRRPHDTGAVERRHGGDELEHAAADGARQRADRCLAAAAKCFYQIALRFERDAGIHVVDLADDLPD